MIYALIKNGIVENVIVADESFAQNISNDWDYVVRIDEMENQPAIGWSYDLDYFVPPVVENEGE